MHTSGQLREMPTGSAQNDRRIHLALWPPTKWNPVSLGLIPGGLILLALALRLACLTFQPLWWDEGWSLYFATTGVGTLLELTAVDIHPPLYYLLLHLWIELFGPGLFSVRLLSVLIGTATVPLLYATGRRLLGERGGLLAAFLLAVSPFHVYYSQEVRMYAFVAFLGLLTLYSVLRWHPAEGGFRWPVWLGYVLSATAALYTQYYAAFLLLALNLVILINWLRSPRSVRPGRPLRDILPWLAAQLAVAVLFLPWLWYAGEKLLTYVRFKVTADADPAQGFVTYIGRHLAALTWGHAEGFLAGWWWLGLLPLAALLLCLAFLLLRRPSQERLEGSSSIHRLSSSALYGSLLILLAVPLLCGFGVNLAFPFNPPRSERLLLLVLPVYLLLFAGGLWQLWRHRRWLAVLPGSVLVVTALLSLALFYTVPRYPKDDYRPLAGRIQALGLPTDAIVNVHPWQVGYFRSYIPDDDARPSLVLTPRRVIPREQQLWADDPALMAADLEALLAEHGRLWFVDHRAMGRVLERQIEAVLTQDAYPVLKEWHGENTVLSLFAAGKPTPQAIAARFSDWLDLEGAALSPGPLEAGWGVVAIDLYWKLFERPGEPYQIGLRLVDGAGRVWAQRDAPPGGGLEQFDGWPVGEARLDRHGLLVPAGTPPGDYHVTLRVYRSEDISVLPATFEEGSGGEVTLGVVSVARPAEAPPVEALEVEHSLGVEFGDRLRLLGYAVSSPTTLLPGEAAEVDLFWQALVDPGEDFLPRLQLLDSGGTVAAELTEKPVAGAYPTAWWRADELVRDPHALPIPATVPPGRYRLALSLVRAADGSSVEIGRAETSVDLVEVEVQGRQHRYDATMPEHPQQAQFGTSVELTGYDLAKTTRAPGSLLTLALHWHALETPDRNYHTFVHLLDAEGHIVAQHDGPPGSDGKQLPTLGWLPGEYLVDTHLLQLPFDLPNGDYRLDVGLYDPATGQRLGDGIILNMPLSISDDQTCPWPDIAHRAY